MKRLLAVGTYTEHESWVRGEGEGIERFVFDDADGSLVHLGVTRARGLVNPSFLAVDAAADRLYAVSEISSARGPEGLVSEFRIAQDGGLELLRQGGTGGSGPCHVALAAEADLIAISNYESGTLALSSRAASARLTLAGVAGLEGRGPNPLRQEGPHAHQAHFVHRPERPEERFVWLVDLGLDRVCVFRIASNGASPLVREPTLDLVLPPGSGPRHLALHPRLDIAYVTSELTSEVAWFRSGSAPALLGTVSTLPAGFGGENHPAEIRVTADGRHLYVSNRGHDSLAHFHLDEANGTPTLAETTPTLGVCPRHFTLDPAERFVLVAGQNSGDITRLARSFETGRLSEPVRVAKCPTPVCLAFGPWR